MPLLCKGDMGPDVARLHQALLERGALPPDADREVRTNRFGEITTAALCTFQAKAGLVVDGVVGPKTWAALQGVRDAGDLVAIPDYASMSPIGRSALELADQELRRGVAETPLGSNRGLEVDGYLAGRRGDGLNLLCYLRYQGKPCPHCDGKPSPRPACQGSPWCARFAAWCVEGAAQELAAASPLAGWGDVASAHKLRDRARLAKRWRDTPAPGQIGVIIIPTSPGVKAQGHVVLVANVHGEMLATREGNSGNRVAARSRGVSQFAGFIDLG